MALRTSSPLGCVRGCRLFNARKIGSKAPRSGASGWQYRLAGEIVQYLCTDRSPSEVIPLAAEYVEKGLSGPGEMEDSVTDWVINIERRGRRE